VVVLYGMVLPPGELDLVYCERFVTLALTVNLAKLQSYKHGRPKTILGPGRDNGSFHYLD